ncbi:Wadjet anti-phage system protein JetD domain-containing protein [Cytobacillus oceanisediminis]|uniref:Wadjet anti-phage system protein JetD domain-containing protein n=1 Tax=Cytobacillus oceanisediminis TaxID=665099 RepID=UPI001FB2C231|nr:Wadjet anti-phage system protein JetD domain-containing protein [Cytobacillus oceanisediminis]UOE53521.1 hypothetical protein IRB79_16760 [Cytobacillus oceanisediminis]
MEKAKMKITIEQYIANLKKLRFEVMELELYLKNEGLRTPLFYKEMANIILDLVDEGKVKPIKSSKSYSMDSRILNRYEKIKQKAKNDHLKDEMLTNYHTSISMTYYLNRPDQYKKEKSQLMAISQFLTNKRKSVPVLSVNERSYQLFGDEKLLFSKKGKRILANIGITYQDLCCYFTYEPFFYYSVTQAENNSILIVENKDTFFSLKKLFKEGIYSWNGIRFSMLVYGEGNKITRSIDYMDELQVPVETPIYYFGDFDPTGISIFCRVQSLCDREINLMTSFYREMWKRRKDGKVKKDQEWNEEAITRFLSNFDKEEQQSYLRYLKEDQYIPQESLSIEVLRGLSNGIEKTV